MSHDFFTQLEQQLLEAARRDVASSPARRATRRGLGAGRGALAALPTVAAVAAVAAIAAVALSVDGEEPRPASTVGAAPVATPPGPSRPAARVFLLNATMRNGLAKDATERLAGSGARVVGVANAPMISARTSRVHIGPGAEAGARVVTERLGITAAVRPLTDDLRGRAPGADIVVVLGDDVRLRLGPLQVTLKGPDGAVGVALFAGRPPNRGLTLQGERLPSSERYFVWSETAAGRAVGLGFLPFDRTRRRVKGSLERLPAELQTPRRVFVTRETGPDLSPVRPVGPVVLDSGLLG